MKSLARTGFGSTTLALLLTAVVAGQAAGATWTKVQVASGASLSGLATLADGTALVAYEKCVGGGFCSSRTYVKRSTDGGATWGSRWTLPGAAYSAAIAGRGTNVDLAWNDENDDGLKYARSTDSGISFGEPMLITSHYTAGEPALARGPGGLVVVAWGEWPQFDFKVSARVSTNGGASFGPKTSWSTSESGTDLSSVAAGDGVVYVAHTNRAGASLVRRSLDGGASWTKALTIDDTPFVYQPVISAAGSEALVAYGTVDADEHQDVRYRRTTNKGVSWSPSLHLAPESASAYDPVLSMQGGVARVLFATDHGLFYMESDDGLEWSSPERVHRRNDGLVGYAGRPIVAHDNLADGVMASFRASD